MGDDECVFENHGGPQVRSLDPWCATHERSAICCLREMRQRAESAELGCDIAYRREPTQAEGDAHEGATHADGRRFPDGECFVPMGGWTGRRCRVCRRWTWGGPTACAVCVARLDERPNDGRSGRCGIRVSNDHWCILDVGHGGDHSMASVKPHECECGDCDQR